MDLQQSIGIYREKMSASAESTPVKVVKLRQLFVLIATEETDVTKVQFTSLFARLSFLISSHAIPSRESYVLHTFRKSLSEEVREDHLDLGVLSLDILRKYVYAQDVDLSNLRVIYGQITKGQRLKRQKFQREVKVLITEINQDEKLISAQLMEEPFEVIMIYYNRPDRNEDYTDQLARIKNSDFLPLVVNLIDVEIDEAGYYYPSSFVYEPDYLYDVTAIAECFGAFANHQGGYLLRKFLKREVTRPILVGNIANYFLDQLVYNGESDFSEFIKNIFSQDPLGISLLSDQEVREMMVLLEKHFDHIKSIVNIKFERLGITSEQCQIEPAFYSAKYGIQGRLDLFSIDETKANIVELKSGSAFRPNSYGLANNHYHQTLLYDMLVESVYSTELKRNNFILYSKESKDQLRFAPALRSEQREAIKERNELYLHDRTLLESHDFVTYYQQYAKTHRNAIKGFQRKHFEEYIKAMSSLDEMEIAYTSELLQLVLKELYINKLGDPGKDRSSGLASLWLQSIEEKRDQFNILDYLELAELQTDEQETKIVFRKSERSNELSNFRVGDLGVLYPVVEEGVPNVLRHQVYKATVLEIKHNEVVIRLRSRQDNEVAFRRYEHWHIEHDTLDNGYYEMSRSIYEFSRAKKDKRDLLLGRVAPATYDVASISCSHHLTEQQKQIFEEIIASKNYYLLWGPPGTGKTSVMLREMAHHYISHEKERVLFLAYTNRAVDEICDALSSLDPKPSFIRIGSRYSTAERYVPTLLEQQISDIKNRKELRDKLVNQQVYVGTVASVMGKVSLFELIKFDVAIIDEASQLLESSLIGLLTRVNKWILIGDHLQLPAVVRQRPAESAIKNTDLLSPLGIHNLSTSFFERLYKHAQSKDWGHCIGQLTYQGRMHRDIMSFVNTHFYNGKLKTIPGISRLEASTNDVMLGESRMLYVNAAPDITGESIKVNRDEARKVVELCKQLVSRLESNNVPIETKSIGVITPYRAQIAAINKEMKSLLPEVDELITVDTVERYQGGSRDYIIMSTCMNFSFQLRSLVSLSEDGVDRKLNVAITRAKEQFVLVGSQEILEQNDTYKSLIAACKKYSFA